MSTPLPAPDASAEAAALSGNGDQLAGHLGGPDFTALCAEAQAAGERAATIRATYRPVPDVGASLPPKQDTVVGLPLP